MILQKQASLNAVNEGSKNSDDLLSAFDLGPAWARDDSKSSTSREYKDHPGEVDKGRRGRRSGPQGNRGGGRPQGGGRQDRRDRGGRRDGKGGRDFRGRDQKRGPRDLPDPADGLKVNVLPSVDAVHLIVKEIQHRARVYSLFDLAQLFLSARERYRLELILDEGKPVMFRGKSDDSLFLTKEEAVAHFLQSDAFGTLYESEDVEVDPPKGNFQVVAKCGISGEWLGPPNYHGYQANIRRLHRERFSSMPFDRYASKVRTERGEEAVNEWMETMKKSTRWRPAGAGDDAWTNDRAQIERDFLTRGFSQAFEEVRKTELPGNVLARNLSVGILASIKIASGHARRHPAMVIPTICRMLESDHLAIFKKKGKLYCGPARPHPLVDYEQLSERPLKIVRWLDANPDSKLEDLWKDVLPDNEGEPPKEWLVDLFWLLSQGHVLLFSDGNLVLPKKKNPSAGDAQPKSKKGKKAAKPKKAKQHAAPKTKKKRGKNYPAKIVPHAKVVRSISMMKPGALKKLRGHSRLWSRRLSRREKIESLLDD